MAAPKFTQGGWNRNIPPASKYPTIFAGRNIHVARVISEFLPPAEVEANANLIAAAPRLYIALARMVDAYADSCSDSEQPSMVREAIAALAAADGDKP